MMAQDIAKTYTMLSLKFGLKRNDISMRFKIFEK